MLANHELLARITARSDVFGGKPIVRDTRVSVELVLSLLAPLCVCTEPLR